MLDMVCQNMLNLRVIGGRIGVFRTFLSEIPVVSFNMLRFPSLSLALVLARSGHYQLCPGMPPAAAGIGKSQMAHKGGQAVVNEFISHVNTGCVADLHWGTPWTDECCLLAQAIREWIALHGHGFQKQLLWGDRDKLDRDLLVPA